MTNIEKNRPRVTVVIPTYNVEKYINATIDSLLSQTFTDFEIVIVDDCSSDKTIDLINAYNSNKITLYKQDCNQGPAAARAIGFRYAQGEYVAIIDSDDIAAPTRLSEQVSALDSDPTLGMIGSHVAVMNENGQLTGQIWKRPTTPEDAAIGLLFRNTFSSVMTLRKSAIPLRISHLPMAEDYEFNVQVAKHHKVNNINKPLTLVRVRGSGLTQTKKVLMEKCVKEVMREQLQELGIMPTPRELELNRHIGALTEPNSVELLRDVEIWLVKLSKANKIKDRFSEPDFMRNVSMEWFNVCQFASSIGFRAILIWYKSSLNTGFWKPTNKDKVRFFVKCLIRHHKIGGDTPVPQM